MGIDKSTLRIGGATLLERTVAILSELSDDVMVVGAPKESSELTVRLIPDDFPGCGPLGGIGTAVRHARHSFVLCVACDMPLLSAAALAAMANEPRDHQLLIPAVGDDPMTSAAPRLHPLHAIYARSCLAAIERRLHTGRMSAAGLTDDVTTRYLDERWFMSQTGGTSTLLNTNTPAEFEFALGMIERIAGEERRHSTDDP